MSVMKKVPLRKCIGCSEMKPKKDLIRVIRTPESVIEIDFTGRKNGRGAYLCRNENCLNRAIKTKQLNRSLQAEITEDILIRIKKELMKDAE